MSISSAMNAGVSGLTANSNRLATISDNIANSQTFGYKRAGTDFASMAVSENLGTYVAGGVKTEMVRDVENKGAMVGTENPTDIAISGRGMLPVAGIAQVQAGEANLPLMLTSTGSFTADKNGVLRTPSGLVLLGWPADLNGDIPQPPRDTSSALKPVVINRGAVAAEPTSVITMAANLPASATNADADVTAEFPILVEYFDTLGSSQTLTFNFTPANDGATPPVAVPNAWALTVTDNASSTVMGTYDIVFSTTTGVGGSIDTVAEGAGSAPYDATTGILSLSLPGGSGQVIDVGLGAEGAAIPQHLSQLSSVFSPVGVQKNGSSAGTFSGLSIDENGFLNANYSTGFSRVIYQIPVADVPNPNGLRALDNQAFSVSEMSGAVYFWDAGSGPTGGMLGNAREQSTSDVAQELTQLIQTQRAYSSNAKIIQTADEMLQETTNLKR